MHLTKVGVAAVGERADQVQRRGRRMVSAEQSGRIRTACSGDEREVVDRVASIGRQRHPAACLTAVRPRLAELPSHPGDLHNRHAGRVGKHDRHLQESLDLVAHLVGRQVDERLGAVPALQQERFSPRHRRHLLTKGVALPREHQRREGRQVAGHLVDRGPVGPVRLLRRGEGADGIRQTFERGQVRQPGAVGRSGHVPRVDAWSACRRRVVVGSRDALDPSIHVRPSV